MIGGVPQGTVLQPLRFPFKVWRNVLEVTSFGNIEKKNPSKVCKILKETLHLRKPAWQCVLLLKTVSDRLT